MTEEANLRDGSDWSEHEDCIVGNEKGIQNLINACEIALDKGEYYGSDLDSYVGIKKLENNLFIDPKDSTSTKYENVIMAAVLVFFTILILIGIYTVFTWIF